MTTVLYSAIRPANCQTVSDVIRQAARMGYTMTLFNGWSDADLGARYGSSRGPRRDEADANNRLISDIQNACEIAGDVPHIFATDPGDDLPLGYIRA